MRKLSTSLLFASILLAGALTARPLYAESNDGGMKNDQCDMMHGRQGGMMQGDRGGMMGRGSMMQGDREGMMGMMKQMSQLMKQMSQMMDQYSNMMGDKGLNEAKTAPSEPEKK